jgi:biopolymer transport protein ExbD
MVPNKKKMPGINSTSTADIAFMMLLFFLLTTSMATDQGLSRTLPRPPENKEHKESIDVNQRNVLKVMISADNRIMCAGDEVTLPELKVKAKEFIDNPGNLASLPEKTEVDIPFFGRTFITESHIISLQCDRGTRYQVYIDVQNELAAAYNELRDVVSGNQFGRKFNDLNEEEKNAVIKYYSQKISEAEPQTYGDKKK